MSTTEPQESGVPVTAVARPHPAFRKLARACILLARQKSSEAAPSETSTPPKGAVK